VSHAVRAVQAARARRASPGAALADALIKDEIEKLTQTVAEEIATSKVGLPPLASSEPLVDTEDWAADLLRDD
jgi:hypothetical protein